MNKRILIYTQAYNAEKTIKRAVDSVLNQVHDNFIYYISDNGSTDKTREVIAAYAGGDSRIRTLYYDSNSLTRLFECIKLVAETNEFDYFCILDADDEYKPSFLTEMLSFTEDHKLELACCGSDFCDSNTLQILGQRLAHQNMLIDGDAFELRFPEYHVFMRTTWAKLISADVVKQINYDYSDKFFYGSDTLFVFECLKKCNRAGILSKSLHKYYMSAKSASYTFGSFNFARTHSDAYLYDDAINFLKAKVGYISPRSSEFVLLVYMNAQFDTLKVLLNSDLKQAEKLTGLANMFLCEQAKKLAAYEHFGALFGGEEVHTVKRRELFDTVTNWLLSLCEVADDQVGMYCELGQFVSAAAENGDAWVSFNKLQAQFFLENECDDEANKIITELAELIPDDQEVQKMKKKLTKRSKKRNTQQNIAPIKYYSCNMINSFFLNFDGMLSAELMSLCCENIDDKPRMALSETGEDSIKRFVALRSNVINESKKFATGFSGERKYTAGCAKCANYQLKKWDNDDLIHYVNFSMYPAPCQCRCFYCDVYSGEQSKFNRENAEQLYEKMFSAIDYALGVGLISPNAVYQVSSGEITIHPFKDRIFKYVEGQRVTFYTNCFIFDEYIADSLKTNPNSAINLSIDAGTPATWKKVKCVDNFDVVTTNLVKYYKSSSRPGQITLKYIMFPGTNDTVEDYQTVIEIMKLLEVKHLTLSRDTRIKYAIDDEYGAQLINATASFVAMLHLAERTFDLFTFTPKEQEEIVRLATEMLTSGRTNNDSAINSEIPSVIVEDELKKCTDYHQYLKLLSQVSNKYTVIISAHDTPVGSGSTPELASMILSLGTLIPLTTDKFRCAYAAVVDCGTLVFEGISRTRAVRFNTILDEAISLSVVSVGFTGKESVQNIIEINGTNYSKFGRGLNFVVYDKQNRKLIDSVSFDTYNNPVQCYREGVIAAVLDKWQSEHPGVMLLGFKGIAFPDKNLSENEKFTVNNGMTLDYIISHATEKVSTISEYIDSQLGICEVLTPPQSYYIADGSRRFSDYSGECLNIVNGHRVTLSQPLKSERTIWMIGGCGVFGVGARDEGTIASHLQKILNNKVPSQFTVQNFGFYLGETNDIDERILLLNSLPIEQGDIVIVDSFLIDGENIPYADCTALGKRPHKHGELFWDNKGHGTESNYNLIAQKLYDLLDRNNFYPFENSSKITVNTELSKGHSEELDRYKEELHALCIEKFGNKPGKTGAIVMNCNPFTLGHKWLIEQAAKKVDSLIVFVVEEDKSEFPFVDRFDLVKSGVQDLANVAVMKSGKFIISTLTFGDYFNKSKLQDVSVDVSKDVHLFAREIAPAANITVRFAGSEPFDKVTAQYNCEMGNILPKYGVEFIELPRIEIDGQAISASRVRKLLKIRDFDTIAELVPETTLQYLKNSNFTRK